ncbi:MAG TPA: Dabb family protein [Pirellulaceae bacterium]|nr:Dabb family protein [Pirellulaceae bacterium]
MPFSLARTTIFACGFALLGAALATLALNVTSPALAQDKEAAPLRHIVLFKFKADATKEQVQEIVAGFGQLPKKIDGITAFEWGTDVSPEKRSEGFTHCFVVTFKDAKARDTYLPHDAHQAFVRLALPKVEKVLVVDYFAQK